MSYSTTSLHRILRGVAYGVSVVAPLFLLLDPHSHFNGDWTRHLWIIDSYGTHIREHGTLPQFLNPAHGIGSPLPVFYGWLLYPMLGVLAAGMGAMTAVRLAALALVVVQFYALMSAGRRVFGQTPLAYLAATSVIWGTYALSNLYNRGALAEYFAIGFAVTAIGFGAIAFSDSVASGRWFYGWLAALFLLLTIGSHPPTAVLITLFIIFLIPGWVIGRSRVRNVFSASTASCIAGAGVIGLLVLAPWAYACVLFGDALIIARHHTEFLFRADRADSFWARFAPFPYDPASSMHGINTAGTPYLEASINMVLLGILFWNLRLLLRSEGPVNRVARIVLWVAVGWFALLSAISISPSLAEVFGFFAPSLQFAYRLVSHCNAALLVAVFASGVLVAQRDGYRLSQHQTNRLVAVGLAVVILGLGLKLQHASVMALPGDPMPADTGSQLAFAMDYAAPLTVQEASSLAIGDSSVLRFNGNAANSPGDTIKPLSVGLHTTTWLRTNVFVFPWMEMQCDGEKLPPAQLAHHGPFLAVQIPAGVHELRPVWSPHHIWTVLYYLSRTIFAIMLIITLVWAAARGWAGCALRTTT